MWPKNQLGELRNWRSKHEPVYLRGAQLAGQSWQEFVVNDAEHTDDEVDVLHEVCQQEQDSAGRCNGEKTFNGAEGAVGPSSGCGFPRSAQSAYSETCRLNTFTYHTQTCCNQTPTTTSRPRER